MLLDRFLGLFSVDMGIDLGTCNTLVSVRGQGIVLNEPSVVAVQKGTNKVLKNGEAVGWVAKEMLGKTPGSITAIRPLKEGVISDFEITEAMLSYFIRKVNGKSKIFGPDGMASVTADAAAKTVTIETKSPNNDMLTGLATTGFIATYALFFMKPPKVVPGMEVSRGGITVKAGIAF